MEIIYQPKTLEWATTPKICNTNNHRIENKEPNYHLLKDIDDKTYANLVSQTNKNIWVKNFPDPPNSIIINLTMNQCKILLEASKIGIITNRRSTIHKEELDEIEHHIHNHLPINFAKSFIRLNEASPKDGKYGCGPLLSAKEILISLTTSLRAYRSFRSAIELVHPETLYIIPWNDNWDETLEFRVFIHNKRLTCLSQYIWSKDLGWNYDTISNISPSIISFCNNDVIPKVQIDSFVVDIIIVPDNNDNSKYSIQVIELNSFGAELASGSALFHWLNDYDIMYGSHSNLIYVRYIDKN